MDIGAKIKAARKQAGLTQAEFAARLEKSLRMVQKYENGEVIPSFAMLEEIADRLQVPIVDFLPQEQLNDRIESAAMDGLMQIMRHVFETAKFKYTNKGTKSNPEFDGDFQVFLGNGVVLCNEEFFSLFRMVTSSLPGWVEFVTDSEK